MSHDLIVLHGGLSTDLCQGQCEGQGVQVGVCVEGGGEGGQGEGEEGGHQVHQVRHPQQHQQPGQLDMQGMQHNLSTLTTERCHIFEVNIHLWNVL